MLLISLKLITSWEETVITKMEEVIKPRTMQSWYFYAASVVKEGAPIRAECQIGPVLSSQQSSYHLKGIESQFCRKQMLSHLFEFIVSYSLILPFFRFFPNADFSQLQSKM